MKIVHIISAHNRYDARVFKKECVTLARNGFEVTLICCDGKPEECRENVNIKSFSKEKLTKRQRLALLYKNKEVLNFLLKENADIYQFHDIELIEIGRKLTRTKKVIFDCHENWKGYVSGFFPKNHIVQHLFGFFYDFYYKLNLKKFSAIFTVSPNFVRDMKLYNDNVFMVSNYPIIKNLDFGANKADKTNDFIYAGTVYRISNQINTVKALNRISKQRKVTYKIIGTISDSLKNEILNTEGSDTVEFTNWIAKSELDKLYDKSRIGLVLLDYVPICANKEGQLGSNKIFEYMAAGLPVICTDFTLWKELIIDKYNCGICVNPKSVDDIYNAMNYLLSNPVKAQVMGENGRKAVLKEFNWERTESEFVNFYRQIFNS